MKKSKFSESQIVGILKEVELGAKVGEFPALARRAPWRSRTARWPPPWA